MKHEGSVVRGLSHMLRLDLESCSNLFWVMVLFVPAVWNNQNW